MAEPSTHINYSLEEIHRYLHGKMTAGEMHAIEKAALQDPFLADAIEGFNEADLTKAQQHLIEINADLLKEKSQSKIVAFNKKTQWVNIAAMVIVLAGIGVVASYFFKSSNQNNITQVKSQPAKNQVLKDSSASEITTANAQPDTTTFIAEIKASKKITSLKEKANTIAKAADSYNQVEKNGIASDNINMAPVSPVEQNKIAARSFSNQADSQQNAESTQTVLQGYTAGVSITPSTFSGKVIDQNNKPIAGTLIQSADKKEIALSDENGNFSLQKNDSVLNVTASTIGFSSENKILEPGKNNTIKLHGISSNMNDVVVTTALGASKKQRSFGRSSNSDSAMPVGGWQNFNNYVLTKLNKDTTASFVSDDLVELEFSVDDNGNPYNIKITKPLDDQHNAEAINILKNGPKWTNTSKKKKAKVAISF